MLKSVTLRRFKNLDSLTLPLSGMNVLVGTNNSGKSSALQGIAFAVSVAQTAKIHGVGRNLASTLAPEQLIYAPLRDVMALASGGALRQDPDKAIEVEFVSDVLPTAVAPFPSTRVSVRRGRNSNLAVEVSQNNHDTADLSGLAPPFCIYVPGLAGIPAVEPYRTPAALRRAAARGDANSVLRNVLWALHQDGGAWTRFLDNLQKIFSGYEIGMHFDPDRDESILATVSHGDVELPLDAAGTGFLQAVQILAYAAKDAPPLLLLDEPDSHLHPDRQRHLVRLLSELAKEGNFQVLIATHSRHVIDALEADAAIHWVSNGKLHPPEETDIVSVLTELGALDKGDQLRGGAIDAVVLTEDKHSKVLIPLLIAAGFDKERISVWSYATCTQIEKARVLAQFITEHAPATRVIVHTDRDYRSDAAIDALEKLFDAANITFFVTKGTDAESHYLDVEHVLTLYPEIPRPEVETALEVAVAAAREDSLSRLSRELNRRKIAENDRRHEPNPMAVAAAATAALDAERSRYTYGKKALGVLVGELQRGRGGQINLLRPSVRLATPVLIQAVEEVRRQR